MAKKGHKDLFKVWDKENECYLSGNRSKTTWSSLTWVKEFLFKQKKDGDFYSYRNKFDLDRYEVHEMELTIKQVIPAADIMKDIVKKKGEIKKYSDHLYALERKMVSVVDGDNSYTVISNYHKGFYSKKIVAELKGLIIDWDNTRSKLKQL